MHIRAPCGEGRMEGELKLVFPCGVWRSGSARMVRDHEVVGSNPTAPMVQSNQEITSPKM